MAQADGLPKSERRERLTRAIFDEMVYHYGQLVDKLEEGGS